MNNPSSSSSFSNSQWSGERLHHASYKDLGSPAEVLEKFKGFLLSAACRESVHTLLTSERSTTRDYSIEINAFDLLQYDPVLGHLLLRYQATLLPLLQDAVVDAQREMKHELDRQDGSAVMNVKGEKSSQGQHMTRVHARLVHLVPTCIKSSLSFMTASDVGKIVKLSGTVVRASGVSMYESARTYKCEGKHGCGRVFVVGADLEQRHNALIPPKSCSTVVDGNRCRGTNFQVVPGGSVHTDYQEIKIQEVASQTGVGVIPRSLLIKLQHDLVDTCQPGDEVDVVGSIIAQWHQSVSANVECDVGIALQAHSIRVLQDKSSSEWNQTKEGSSMGEMEKLKEEFHSFWLDPYNKSNPIAARNLICNSVCPKLYGMQIVKLALLITLIGGVESRSSTQNDPEYSDAVDQCDDHLERNEPRQFRLTYETASPASGELDVGAIRGPSKRWKGYNEKIRTRRRDRSHMLIVGDPGTGKSQFLRFAAAICPRSVLTTGVGTTSAGLTCAAVKDGKGREFVLEAGALVLADKGVCCIDEFGCIQDKDRTSIHEAMEQQTLSVAKAGIVCKLNCRATIIAVMNPRNNLYDNQESLSRNTGLGTPLLSRFDLIFKLMDTSDALRDGNISTYLLNRAIQGSGYECTDKTLEAGPVWNLEKLRGYIAVVKDTFHPKISDDAAELLRCHYERCRTVENKTMPTTVRMLESIIRLSQAHARLMYRNTVELEDAVAVIRIMECSAFAFGGFGTSVDDNFFCDPMTLTFSETEADLEFLLFQHKLLRSYGMLDRLPETQHETVNRFLSSQRNNLYQESELRAWDSLHFQEATSNTMEQDHYGRIYQTDSRTRPSFQIP